MSAQPRPFLIGNTRQQQAAIRVEGEYVTLLRETFYRIRHYDAMEPFFMSIVSSSDHWLFIASTGGLSAGRVSAEQALFPYYTVDRITENNENTGNKAILLVTRDQQTMLWEPFSSRYQGVYRLERNIYKNIPGTALVFEEINVDLGLIYRHAWRTCDAFGFVKTTWLINRNGSRCDVEIVDGLQNLLPANVTSVTQNVFSALLDAYKRSELEPETGLGLFTLSSTLTDLAEPSESLKATTVWQLGLNAVRHLLSSTQLDDFRCGRGIVEESDVRGRRGAYFVHAALSLEPGAERAWHLVAEVGQDSAAVVRLIRDLRGDQDALRERLERDIAANSENLTHIVDSADGAQLTNDRPGTAHHFANVMFNVMRGGVFADQYWIDTADLRDFVSVRNRAVLQDCADFFASLPAKINVGALQARADALGSVDLARLCYAYLPLTFSRRHGDPSRPWNRFSIHVKKPDGTRLRNYEGNWRDIFQNWEALACSYPEFVEGMISTFLSATTVDGYNPYRITRQGIDWELPEPHNPWANIGYWSDHQIIYLLKLMEVSAKVHPGRLEAFLARSMFSCAQVPYRIKPYADLLKNPYSTIEFGWALEQEIQGRVREHGTDGKLVHATNGTVFHATLAEKLLILLVAKLANLVPEGGIWMNTQRPEWNDANNALVGKGLSVVTLGYLRRYIVFSATLFARSALNTVPITRELHTFYRTVSEILTQYQSILDGAFSDEQRRDVMDALGQSASDYRWSYYEHGLSGELIQVPTSEVVAFFDLAQRYVEHSLRANQRDDGLYHAYNILHLDDRQASISHLYEMLEGQVAILSSGLLSGDEALALLQHLRHSALYRADQHSYLLYPNRTLPGFLEKNCIRPEQVRDLALIAALVEHQDQCLITRDVDGIYHFSGHIHNVRDVTRALETLQQQSQYAEMVAEESARIKALFEDVFHHAAFTGRSGTFFAYEGLGSVYWHMVSKLLLAAQETALRARSEPCGAALMEAYFDIRRGLGFNKTPADYGAFPTDPYSHTPEGGGAKQPGMTGSVKEEILTRMAELGLFIEDGRLAFDPVLLNKQELLTAPALFEYLDGDGHQQQIELHAGSLVYLFCQVPVIVRAANKASITVDWADGSSQVIAGHVLAPDISQHIFQRDGMVRRLTLSFIENGK
jgi:hypothetical protein